MPRTEQIKYPHSISEFEIQAQLYSLLRAEGIDVRGCVPAICGEWNRNRRVFFDLVIFNALKEPVLIIECKNKREHLSPHQLNGRQKRRYEKFELEILVCDRESQIKGAFERAVEILSECAFA